MEGKTMLLIAVALIMSILIGLFLGVLLGMSIVDGYKSRKTCRECRRTIAECGFSVDGIRYNAIKKE